MSTEFCFFHPRDPKRSPIPSTWSATSINAVVEAIQDAWKQIESFDYWKSAKFEGVHYDDEDELTTKIAEILNDRLDNATTGYFRKEIFQTVVRDAKQSTANLSSTEQMPDLQFRLTRTAPGEDREESALFVEAKLINATSGCSEYVINGLDRFVVGKYAPRTTFGMMLGYCTPEFNDPAVELKVYFNGATSTAAKRCASTVSATGGHPTTDHSRAAPAAPAFRAIHIWVERPNTSTAPSSGSP